MNGYKAAATAAAATAAAAATPPSAQNFRDGPHSHMRHITAGKIENYRILHCVAAAAATCNNTPAIMKRLCNYGA